MASASTGSATGVSRTAFPAIGRPTFAAGQAGLQDIYETLNRTPLAPLTDKQKTELFNQIELRFGTLQKFKLMMADKFMKYNVATGPVHKNYNVWADGTFLSNLLALMRKDASVRNATFKILIGQADEQFDVWATRVLENSVRNTKSRRLIDEVSGMLNSAGGLNELRASFTSRGVAAPEVKWKTGEARVSDSDQSIHDAMPFLAGRPLSAKQSAMKQRMRKAIMLLALHDLLKPDGELTKLRDAVNQAFDTFKTAGNCTPDAVARAKERAMAYSDLLNHALSVAAQAHEMQEDEE